MTFTNLSYLENAVNALCGIFTKKHKRTPEAGVHYKVVAAQRFELRTLRV